MAGIQGWFDAFPLGLEFAFDSWVRICGLFVFGFGILLFAWSIVARGRYAVSWDMPEDHRLVTWGPYRYVRHPSYLAYFLLVPALFLTRLNLLILPCFMAVPGYYFDAEAEERMLIQRFGEEYLEYKSRTGRFFPKMKK